MEEVCRWAGSSNPAERKFVEGLEVVVSGNLIQIGKNKEKSTADVSSIHVRYMQSSALRDTPHTITGEINNVTGKIIKFSCSCKAGLGEKCKHIMGAFF